MGNHVNTIPSSRNEGKSSMQCNFIEFKTRGKTIDARRVKVASIGKLPSVEKVGRHYLLCQREEIIRAVADTDNRKLHAWKEAKVTDKAKALKIKYMLLGNEVKGNKQTSESRSKLEQHNNEYKSRSGRGA